MDNESTPTSSVSSTAPADMAIEVKPFVKRRLFLPERRCSHSIVQVTGYEIGVISVRQMKVDTGKIIDDYKKRMLPRFK